MSDSGGRSYGGGIHCGDLTGIECGGGRDWLVVGGEMRRLRIVVEEHPDGFIAYPLGLAGVVVGQGD